MHRNVIETIMGAVVLLVAGWFLYTAYQGQAMKKQIADAYHVTALFDNVAGISAGSDVRMGGVKVGVVERLSLDPQSYRAKLEIALAKSAPLPDDTSASIVGDGLLGSKFVSLVPGASEEMLKDGSKIEYTQSSVSLEELIGKFVFSAGGVDKGGPANAASEAPNTVAPPADASTAPKTLPNAADIQMPPPPKENAPVNRAPVGGRP